MLMLFRCLSVLPLWLLHAVGHLLGWLGYWGSATYRQRFRAHAALAGLPAPQTRQAIGHAGCMVSELPRLWFGRPVPLLWDNEAAPARAYQAGRGVLFLTPHLGCFEVTAQALAQRFSPAHGPLTVLYRPARKAWLTTLIETARARPGLVPVPTTLAGVRQMMRALRQGEAVGLLPDQVPPQGMGIWSPVFGRDAYTMTLAARLVQQTGATPLLVWGERLAWGRGFKVHFSELPQPLSGDMETAVAQINQAMEQLVRTCPQQYQWGYARYKAPA